MYPCQCGEGRHDSFTPPCHRRDPGGRTIFTTPVELRIGTLGPVRYVHWSVRRRQRWPGLAALGIAVVAGMVSWRPVHGLFPVRPQAATKVLAATTGPRDLRVVEPGYTLVANPTTAVVSVLSPSGVPYTSFPLTMLAGTGDLPAADRRRVVQAGNMLVAS
ncbi:MAG: hypothetical protein ACREQ5_29260, partial [Candidatus Dormibacteria bacterium]